MKRELTVVSLLLWVLLAVGPLTPTIAQAEGLTLTLRTDQATYQIGSQATVTLILRSATPMTGEIGAEALGCAWNIVMLDAAGTEVFNAREERVRDLEAPQCPAVAIFRNVPPPIVERATIPLKNTLRGGDPLSPGLYTIRAILEWFRTSAAAEAPGLGLGPQSVEMVIEITTPGDISKR
jgi:hypothetical protein